MLIIPVLFEVVTPLDTNIISVRYVPALIVIYY